MQGVESVAADTSENLKILCNNEKVSLFFFIEGVTLDILNTSLKI